MTTIKTTIKIPHKTCLALLLWGLATAAVAAPEEAPPAPEDIICPELVTEQECRAHQDALARLPSGEARAAYQKQFQALQTERRKACSCQHLQAASRAPER